MAAFLPPEPLTPDEARARLADWSPLFRDLLATVAEVAQDEYLAEPFGPGRYALRFGPEADLSSRAGLQALRRFRREQSLRLALREIGGLAPWYVTARELSDLADFCLQQVFEATRRSWEVRLGVPWDERRQRPTALCVLGFGKLGGQELNFCSDVDLVFCYEGGGHPRRDGKPIPRSNAEVLQRIGGDFAARVGERQEGWFLYNVDLRLRPEGDSGPLVPSVAALENYYAASGQIWERLALIRARPVAGQQSLGHELCETLHPFRYPRNPPPSLLAEVARMKVRTESEVIGEELLANDIKQGRGGLREVEFLVQSLQLLHGGKNPFLQTGNTREALLGLWRYDLLPGDDARALLEAYGALRVVENRLQMRAEEQTHRLPPADSAARGQLAASFGFADTATFDRSLAEIRATVQGFYDQHFGDTTAGAARHDAWVSFFSGQRALPVVEEQIKAWFGRPSGEVQDRLRRLVVGGSFQGVNRDGVSAFLDLSRSFDQTLPRLAHPVRTLERLHRFVERYGAPRTFLKSCQDDPRLFEALALLFDRSEFLFQLVVAHPEIMDELLRTAVGRRKSVAEHRAEIRHGPIGEEFAGWLWLYVKAEQVRIATAEVFDVLTLCEVERSLSRLAEGTLAETLPRFGLEGTVALVGLGKLGSEELAFGSDLDLLLLAETASDARTIKQVHAWQRLIGYKEALGPTFDVDLRLRPHGSDGPLLVTIETLRAYHQDSGGGQPWERLILTRSRPLAGRRDLLDRFAALREEILFTKPLTDDEAASVWDLRRRAEQEKGQTEPPSAALKAGPGGRMDLDTLAQLLLCKYGYEQPAIRHRATRAILEALGQAGLVPAESIRELVAGYEELRKMEHILRRDTQKSETQLPEDRGRQESLAHAMDLSSFADVLDHRTQSAQRIRQLVLALLRETFMFH